MYNDDIRNRNAIYKGTLTMTDDYKIGQQLYCDGWSLSDCENIEQRIGFLEYQQLEQYNENYLVTICKER